MRINAWISVITLIVGISLTIKNYVISAEKGFYITQWTVSLLLIFFIAIIIFREITTLRKEKYANINEHRHRCIHLLRDLTTFLLTQVEKQKNNSNNLDGVRKRTQTILTEILNEVSTNFSMLTGTLCRATIKTIYKNEDKIYVFAFARDGKSRHANLKKDKERREKNMDPIEENEDFQLLYEDFGPKQCCFFSNNLITRRSYRTSSFKVYDYPPENITFWDVVLQHLGIYRNWALPYKSTIVWPIQQLENPDLEFKVLGCVGFLAIDSESRNVFKKRWDCPIGAEIADALFHPINLLSSIGLNTNGK